MSQTLKLELPKPDFDAIHAALDKVRSTSKTVTVPKAALEALLRDHGALLHRYRIEG